MVASSGVSDRARFWMRAVLVLADQPSVGRVQSNLGVDERGHARRPSPSHGQHQLQPRRSPMVPKKLVSLLPYEKWCPRRICVRTLLHNIVLALGEALPVDHSAHAHHVVSPYTDSDLTSLLLLLLLVELETDVPADRLCEKATDWLSLNPALMLRELLYDVETLLALSAAAPSWAATVAPTFAASSTIDRWVMNSSALARACASETSVMLIAACDAADHCRASTSLKVPTADASDWYIRATASFLAAIARTPVTFGLDLCPIPFPERLVGAQLCIQHHRSGRRSVSMQHPLAGVGLHGGPERILLGCLGLHTGAIAFHLCGVGVDLRGVGANFLAEDRDLEPLDLSLGLDRTDLCLRKPERPTTRRRSRHGTLPRASG
jgi:hypothetical protein